jgi:hypothetical protein
MYSFFLVIALEWCRDIHEHISVFDEEFASILPARIMRKNDFPQLQGALRSTLKRLVARVDTSIFPDTFTVILSR